MHGLLILPSRSRLKFPPEPPATKFFDDSVDPFRMFECHVRMFTSRVASFCVPRAVYNTAVLVREKKMSAGPTTPAIQVRSLPCRTKPPQPALTSCHAASCARPRQCFVHQGSYSKLARRPKAACCGGSLALLFRVTGWSREDSPVPAWTQQCMGRVGFHGQPPCSRRRGPSMVGGLLMTRCRLYE